MTPTLLIIGPISQSDLKIITSEATTRGYTTVHAHRYDVTCLADDCRIMAVIYCLTPDTDSSLELPDPLPLNADDRAPLFYLTHNEISGLWEGLRGTAIITTPVGGNDLYNLFSGIDYFQRINRKTESIINEALKYKKQKYQLVKLSTALTAHYDLDSLLMLILRESCSIVNADAGSIYVRERSGPGKAFTDRLRFKVSLNNSIAFEPGKEFSIDIDENRIAGYVALTGEPLNIPDVYDLDPLKPYRYNTDLDEQFHYRIKSMITVPLKNLEDTIVGVLQLMNKKKESETILDDPEKVRREVVDFSFTDEEFLQSIGALAAVSIERTQLYENIEKIFEGFLGSSIEAIDARDRATSGHSLRVMEYAVAFADEINRAKEGCFADVTFNHTRKRQFQFAALLHDIGKIGVPEAILTKESRIPQNEFDTILGRIEFVRHHLLKPAAFPDYASSWDSTEDLDTDRAFLEETNNSGYLSPEGQTRLKEIGTKWYTDLFGFQIPLLTEQEMKHLSIVQGNLTTHEREIINSHARTSYKILSQIPWTPDLEQIPAIAAHHHEMVDGSGYPEGLSNDQLSLETKILTVVDIYDALVALDRPYKPALPPERALAILRSEAHRGKLDTTVVEFFIEKEIYKRFSGDVTLPKLTESQQDL